MSGITQFISSAYGFSSLIWSRGTKCTLVWFGSSSEVKGELSDGSLCFSVCCSGSRADTTPHREQRCRCQIGHDGIVRLIASVRIPPGRCSSTALLAPALERNSKGGRCLCWKQKINQCDVLKRGLWPAVSASLPCPLNCSGWLVMKDVSAGQHFRSAHLIWWAHLVVLTCGPSSWLANKC